MTRRILIGLAPLIASAASAAGVAQADVTPPHWETNMHVIRNEEHVSVVTLGAGQPITLHLSAGAMVSCRVAFTDVIWNPLDESAGLDEMTSFAAFKCKQSGPAVCPTKAVEVHPLGLPWHSHLSTEVPSGGEGNDLIEGVELNISCAQTKGPGVFKGSLGGLVTNTANCFGANHSCSRLEWGAQSSLGGESGAVTVSGLDKVVGRTPEASKLNIEVCDCNQRP